MKGRCTRTLRLVAVLLVSGAMAQTAMVRGRVDRYAPPDVVTASYVKVVLCRDSDRLDSTYTGQDGMYYFRDVPVGTYRLEATPPPSDMSHDTLEYNFEIPPGQSKADIPAQLLDRLVFKEPVENAPVPPGDTIRVEGTHSFPDSTRVWFLFSTEAATYLFLGGSTVLRAGQPWSVGLDVPSGATRLMAALATLEARGEFTRRVAERDFGRLEALPRGTRIITTGRFP